jgi:predicted nuclease of predicted toxin-antitoxin system
VLQLVSDHDFHERIIRGLFRQLPELDLVRAREEELDQARDPELLAWAAENERIVLSHDRQTLVGYAHDRVARGLPMRGVFIVPNNPHVGRAIGALLIYIMCSAQDEWDNQVEYIKV